MSSQELSDFDRRQLDYIDAHGAVRFVLLRGLPFVGGLFFLILSSIDYLTRYGVQIVEPFPQAAISHFLGWVPGSILVGLGGPLMFLFETKLRNESDD